MDNQQPAIAWLPAFRFRVNFQLENINLEDGDFESVSGLGGICQPGNSRDRDGKASEYNFQPVIFRRSMRSPKASALLRWILNCLNKGVTEGIPAIQIEVLNGDQQPAMRIILKEAFLRSWTPGELHAQKSQPLMEEISFDYKSIEIQ